MRKKARNTHRKQPWTSEEARVETMEQSQRLKVRVGKRPVDKPISDKRPKQRIRVSRHLESPSMSKKNK